jgi:hypothetical protein
MCWRPIRVDGVREWLAICVRYERRSEFWLDLDPVCIAVIIACDHRI